MFCAEWRVAVAIGSAVDAYMFARQSEGGTRVALSARPSANGVTARVSLLVR